MTTEEAIQARVPLFYGNRRSNLWTTKERREWELQLKRAGYKLVRLRTLPWLKPDFFWVLPAWIGYFAGQAPIGRNFLQSS